MNPLVSVIMPVYNVEKYVGNSIESILKQTYDNFELIIVIDGSPDNSGSIAEKYSQKDSRINVIYKDNGGLSDARNCGIDKANGDYIYFLDSDDYIENNLLDISVNNAEIHKLDITVFGFYADYEDYNGEVVSSKAISPLKGIYNKDNIHKITLDDEFHNYIGYAWNKLYKSNVIKENKIRFIKGLSLIEDIEFNYLAVKYAIKIGFIDKALYHYMQRQRTTLVNEKYNNLYNLKLRAANLRVKILNEWSISEKIMNEESAKLYFSALNSGLKSVSICNDRDINSKLTEIKKIIEIDKRLNYKDNLSSIKKNIREEILLKLINMRLYRLIVLKYNFINKLK